MHIFSFNNSILYFFQSSIFFHFWIFLSQLLSFLLTKYNHFCHNDDNSENNDDENDLIVNEKNSTECSPLWEVWGSILDTDMAQYVIHP